MIKNKGFYNNLLKLGFDRDTVLFMIAFERKYKNIYHSIMSTLSNKFKANNELPDINFLIEDYINQWKLLRPEVEEYRENVEFIYKYCYQKFLRKWNS